MARYFPLDKEGTDYSAWYAIEVMLDDELSDKPRQTLVYVPQDSNIHFGALVDPATLVGLHAGTYTAANPIAIDEDNIITLSIPAPGSGLEVVVGGLQVNLADNYGLSTGLAVAGLGILISDGHTDMLCFGDGVADENGLMHRWAKDDHDAGVDQKIEITDRNANDYDLWVDPWGHVTHIEAK